MTKVRRHPLDAPPADDWAGPVEGARRTVVQIARTLPFWLRTLVIGPLLVATTACGATFGPLPQFANLEPGVEGILADGQPLTFKRDEILVSMDDGRDIAPLLSAFGLQVKSPPRLGGATYILEPGPGYQEDHGAVASNCHRAGLSGSYHFQNGRSASIYNTICKIRLRRAEFGVSTVSVNGFSQPG